MIVIGIHEPMFISLTYLSVHEVIEMLQYF